MSCREIGNKEVVFHSRDIRKSEADLTAYPIARFVIEPERANPPFELIRLMKELFSAI